MPSVSVLLPADPGADLERGCRHGYSANMMKRKLLALSRRYQAALQKHLQQGPGSCVQPVHQQGQQAITLELETLDLARIHMTREETLKTGERHYAKLKSGAANRNGAVAKEIAGTQRLVEKSVKTIDRFAREFSVQHD